MHAAFCRPGQGQLMAGWNQRPAAALKSGVPTDRQGGLLRSGAHAAGSSVAFYGAVLSRQYGWDSWTVQVSTGVLLYALSLFMFLSSVYYLSTAVQHSRQQPWEKGLSAKQKTLFGIPLPHTTQSAARGPKQSVNPAEEHRSTPLGPPLRHTRPITPTVGENGSPFTPRSTGRRRTATPYSSSPTVTTPEQLRQFLDAFEDQAQASPGQPAPAALYGGQQPFGAVEQGMQQYRPSLQARGQTGSPLRADGLLSPSSQETFNAVLARLQTDARTLEAWTDRFREWLAAEVLKPLVRQVRSAHEQVAASASQLGWTRIELSSLGEPEAASSNRGLEADEEAQLNMLREALAVQLRSPLQETQRKAVLTCLQAVRQHQQLAALLRGDNPRGLLPPVPRGYIISRVVELAAGPCVAEFTWNAGGAWQDKPWSIELLTDSALVFYLFAAFLEAPKWVFPAEPSQLTGTSAPLYIGSLPSRPAQHCTALLPVRPASLPKGLLAVLALTLASREPHFTLVMHGEPVLTRCDYTAVFHSLLLLIQCGKLENYGMLGANLSLDYLGLAQVVQPADRAFDSFRGFWQLWLRQ